jgi:hypothetical protein
MDVSCRYLRNRGSDHGNDSCCGKRASEIVLVPLRASASLPPNTAEVAELVLASTSKHVSTSAEHIWKCWNLRHVEAALLELDHVLTLGALLPSATLGDIHEKLDKGVAWAQTLVLSALAKSTCLIVAEDAGTNVGPDVLGSDELGAFSIRAEGRVRCRELLNLEVKILDECLWQNGAAYVQRNRQPAAAGREQCRVDKGASEEVDKTYPAVRMSLRLALQRQCIFAGNDSMQAQHLVRASEPRIVDLLVALVLPSMTVRRPLRGSRLAGSRSKAAA